MARRLPFSTRLVAVSLSLHGFVAWRLWPAWSAHPAWTLPFAVLLAASALLIPAALWAQRSGSVPLAWASMLCMGWFSSVFVLTVLRDLLWWAIPADWTGGSALAVPLLALLASLRGFWNARRTARVRTVEVPLAGLPAALHGFSIAQVTDLHVGATIRRPAVEAVVQRVNALRPDVVAITGDLVDGGVPELLPHVAPLAGLASRHGSFFVTGNHEYYSGAHAWIDALPRLGITVLMNRHVVLRHDGATLALAGVADPSAHHFDPAHRSDPAAALAGAPAQLGAKILLAHQPRSAAEAERAGFDLQVSGHTHGGQFLPWNFLVRLQQPFTAGLERLGRLWVYTSRGTGYWGPPMRLFAPSEITLLRLVAAATMAA